MLLMLRELTTKDEILNLMRSSDAWYENGILAIDELAEVVSERELDAVVSKYCTLAKVPGRVVRILRENQQRLKGKLGDLAGDA